MKLLNLLISFATLALFITTLSLAPSHTALAGNECLLDNGVSPGVADSSDTDGNAIATFASSTACGVNAQALAANATAVGQNSGATASRATAIGRDANAVAVNSTAIGAETDIPSTAAGAIALGQDANIGAQSSSAIAIGQESDVGAGAAGAIAIGGDTLVDSSGATVLAAQAIAIGAEARAEIGALGGIAIGGDLDGDGLGAQSTKVNAIAIGADVVANAANTMTVGVPILIDDQNATVANRSLIKMVNNGPAGFKLTDKANATSWSFAQTSYLGFTMDNLNTPGAQEARFFQGGNVSILGTLSEGSSRSYKKGIVSVNSLDVLDKVSLLPIKQWTYKHEDDSVKHFGPMAEDFHKAFGLGSSAKSIASLDSAGVALASIQALRSEKDAQIASLKESFRLEMKALREELAELRNAKSVDIK